MPTINTEIEFHVQCSVCSKTLDTTVEQRSSIVVFVEPCDNCMSDARDEGHQSGISEGLSH